MPLAAGHSSASEAHHENYVSVSLVVEETEALQVKQFAQGYSFDMGSNWDLNLESQTFQTWSLPSKAGQDKESI